MRMTVIAVGHRMPAWVSAGFDEYARRLPREARLDLIEVRPVRRSPGVSVERAMAQEESRIDAAVPAGCQRVVLDERGVEMTSVGLAHRVESWLGNGHDVALVIGGADGLTETFRRSADLLLSLSRLTLPHGLVRVLLAEQLYRAISIMHNHPYHRE
ncbi:MAG TPA: 23S rRNA (pseudouridine(1915)-N(3))-methyltransferase RlmH [Burkholderiales bacterium]|nr:23S rRNA (pseudouridine(1915)-N(3))-methyltransferase RlmH [Betaproteobacteria bacterium]HQR51889.1 23S rRNA (pseudouridine(1915)-N(3))-methyltransferase RlmH [Burkholderiales bacterium]